MPARYSFQANADSPWITLRSSSATKLPVVFRDRSMAWSPSITAGILLIVLSAKNAILIVDVARDRRLNGNPSIIEAAVEAARARFRPIIMTSFAFILGVAPLVVASGAGASARKSIGITVFSGMIASTCLAVLFAPSIFVVVQRFEEWGSARKHPRIQPAE